MSRIVKVINVYNTDVHVRLAHIHFCLSATYSKLLTSVFTNPCPTKISIGNNSHFTKNETGNSGDIYITSLKKPNREPRTGTLDIQSDDSRRGYKAVKLWTYTVYERSIRTVQDVIVIILAIVV